MAKTAQGNNGTALIACTIVPLSVVSDPEMAMGACLAISVSLVYVVFCTIGS